MITVGCRIEGHDVVDEDGGEVEEEEAFDRLVPVNLLLQVLPELQVGHVLVDQHAQHRFNLLSRELKRLERQI